MKNIYFVLFGEFECIVNGMAKFGEKFGLGWTIGEEVLFHKGEGVKRLETIRARSSACLLQLKVSDLEGISQVKRSAFLQRDYEILMSLFVQNYTAK